jgi:hypothetical protein
MAAKLGKVPFLLKFRRIQPMALPMLKPRVLIAKFVVA